MSIKQNILEKINEFKKISIFVHEKPDPDALGSAFALFSFIKENYKDKEVRVVGLEKIDEHKVNLYFINYYKNYFETLIVDDEFVLDSLAIIVDTPTSSRVLSQKHLIAKERIVIDHHPRLENFAQITWIEDWRSSASEMVAEFFKELNLYIKKDAASFLYFGIITDTNRFLYSNTSDKTLALAAWLLSFKFETKKIHNLLYLNSFDDFKLERKITKKIKKFNDIGYLILKNKKIKSSKINLLGNFNDFKIWVSIYYDYEKRKWFGSIRSQDFVINTVAAKYNGGGHKLAAGFSLLTKKEFKNVLLDLQKVIDNNERI